MLNNKEDRGYNYTNTNLETQNQNTRNNTFNTKLYNHDR